MKILQIDSSITGSRSVSRLLSALVVERLGGDNEVIYRDLVADDLPHFSAITAPSSHPLSKTTPTLDVKQQAMRDNSDAILEEFIQADIVVIGVPMYNFTLPSELKAWVDRIIVPGTTFRIGPEGPEGLIDNKRIILAIARGGVYGAGSAAASTEHAESYLRLALGFIGLTTIEAVIGEGLNSPHTREEAIAAAREAVFKLAA